MDRPIDRRSLVLATVAGVILVASLIPGEAGAASRLPGADKLLHAVGYAVLAATALWARRTRSPRVLEIVGVVLAVAVYGGVVELFQLPMATRHASVADAGANLVGAVVGAVVWAVVGSRSPAVDP